MDRTFAGTGADDLGNLHGSFNDAFDGGDDGSLRFLPDFAITREREIFFPNQFGRFISDDVWNKRCDKDHKRLFKKLRKELKGIREYVEGTAQGEWVAVEGDLAGVILPHADEMAGLLAEIERLCSGCKNLGHERNGIYLRFSHTDYGKGPALREVARRLGIPPAKVVAGGDNFNDLTMLSPDTTTRPVCPGNAVPEVKERVKEIGGAVGKSAASVGIAEALEELFVQGGRSQEDLESSAH